MPSASDPRQPNRTRQPASRPAQPGQRPAQPTQRAAQPGTRPVQPFARSAQPAQRTGQQPSARSVQHPASRAAQQPTARTAQPAGGTRFKQQAPVRRTQATQSHSHHARGLHGVAPATRSSYDTRARRGAQKKSSPVPMIIGVVVAVLALAAIAFFVVPAVKGFFAGEDTKVTAGQQVTVTIPDGASGDTIARSSPRTISSKIPRITMRRSKSSMPICRSSLVPIRSPHSWMRPRLFSSSWKAPMRAPMRLLFPRV